jgi:hypothetical protein
MIIVQLGSIELLYINAQPLHKVKIIKRNPMRRIMQSMLAFAQEREKVDPQRFGSNLFARRRNHLSRNIMQGFMAI